MFIFKSSFFSFQLKVYQYWSQFNSIVRRMDSWGDQSFNSSFGANTTHQNNSFSGQSNAFNNSQSNSVSHSRNTLNVSAQLEIQKLPADTSCNQIREIFGRYGRITRIVLDHSNHPFIAFILLFLNVFYDYFTIV